MYSKDAFEEFFRETGLKKQSVAASMNMTKVTFYRKFNGLSEFTIGDADHFATLYGKKRMESIFFAK